MTAPSVREAFEAIPFDDDADQVKTWKGLALSAISDMRRYADDDLPNRRMVSVEAYEADAVRLATPPAPTPGAAREKIARALCCPTGCQYPDRCCAQSVQRLAHFGKEIEALTALLPDATTSILEVVDPAAIRADERERCAAIADEAADETDGNASRECMGREIAAAIRAAGEK